MYVVTVDWKIEPALVASFREKIMVQAAQSLTEEEGCIRFDVCESPSDTGRFFLYEIYASEAAFNAHLEMDYSVAFLPIADGMTIEKKVEIFALIAAN